MSDKNVMSGTTTPSPWSVENYDTYLQNKKKPKEAYKYLRLSPYDRKEDKKVTRQEAEDTLNANTDVKNVIGNLLSIAGFRETFLDTLIKRTTERTGETVTTDPTPAPEPTPVDTVQLKTELNNILALAKKTEEKDVDYSVLKGQVDAITGKIDKLTTMAEYNLIAGKIEAYKTKIAEITEENNKLTKNKQELTKMLESLRNIRIKWEPMMSTKLTKLTTTVDKLTLTSGLNDIKTDIQKFQHEVKIEEAYQNFEKKMKNIKDNNVVELMATLKKNTSVWENTHNETVQKWTNDLKGAIGSIDLEKSKQRQQNELKLIMFDNRLARFKTQKSNLSKAITNASNTDALVKTQEDIVTFKEDIQKNIDAVSEFKGSKTEEMKNLSHKELKQTALNTILQQINDCYDRNQIADINNLYTAFKNEVETVIQLRKQAENEIALLRVNAQQDDLSRRLFNEAKTMIDTMMNQSDFENFQTKCKELKASIDLKKKKDILIAQINTLTKHPKKKNEDEWENNVQTLLSRIDVISKVEDLQNIQNEVEKRQKELNKVDDDEKISAEYRDFVTFIVDYDYKPKKKFKVELDQDTFSFSRQLEKMYSPLTNVLKGLLRQAKIKNTINDDKIIVAGFTLLNQDVETLQTHLGKHGEKFWQVVIDLIVQQNVESNSINFMLIQKLPHPRSWSTLIGNLNFYLSKLNN